MRWTATSAAAAPTCASCAPSGARRRREEASAMTGMTISRRGFLQGAGALIVTFGLPIKLRAQLATPIEKRALYSSVDSWLAVGQDGGVTLFTGKVELGTGVETALSQIVAGELDVPGARLIVAQGDNPRPAAQGETGGSKAIEAG